MCIINITLFVASLLFPNFGNKYKSMNYGGHMFNTTSLLNMYIIIITNRISQATAWALWLPSQHGDDFNNDKIIGTTNFL